MPTRTCVGCRRQADKQELWRVVCIEGEYEIDREGRLPGRGAYFCKSDSCRAEALKTGALGRALKVKNAKAGKTFA